MLLHLQRIAVPFEYPVYFTEGVFSPSNDDLAAAIAAAGATLASDEVVQVRAGAIGAPGELIPPRPEPAHAVELDQAAIAAIMADTRDVAAMLAEVFDEDGDDEEAEPVISPQPKAEAAAAVAPEVAAFAQGLDSRYQAVLVELLTKPSWTKEEVRVIDVNYFCRSTTTILAASRRG